jgi:hypothetical protein
MSERHTIPLHPCTDHWSIQVEWLLPDRRLDVPDDRNILVQLPVFLKEQIRVPHRKIVMSEEARGVFSSFQTMYNIKVKKATDYVCVVCMYCEVWSCASVGSYM